MKKNMPVPAFLLFLVLAPALYGQTGTLVQPLNQPAVSEFPQWAKDLRRAEIIAFGTFPFTMFTSTFVMDTWRASNHNWDGKYMPWPLKTAGAIEMTSKEHEIVFAAAGLLSITLAVTDLVIIKIKRHKARQWALQLPEGTPIIIKRPWPGTGPESPAEGPEIPDGSAPPLEP
ncbi:MAG: hypothetical protein LBK02_07920 [Treponema sp.]|nr:hypothetical protein [Treponema sp.]